MGGGSCLVPYRKYTTIPGLSFLNPVIPHSQVGTVKTPSKHSQMLHWETKLPSVENVARKEIPMLLPEANLFAYPSPLCDYKKTSFKECFPIIYLIKFFLFTGLFQNLQICS